MLREEARMILSISSTSILDKEFPFGSDLTIRNFFVYDDYSKKVFGRLFIAEAVLLSSFGF